MIYFKALQRIFSFLRVRRVYVLIPLLLLSLFYEYGVYVLIPLLLFSKRNIKLKQGPRSDMSTGRSPTKAALIRGRNPF